MVTDIIEKRKNGFLFDREDIKTLLSLSETRDMDYLFAEARKARQAYFGTQVFLYGFLYFSTHCRNNCRFCQYRRANTDMERYRKTERDILKAAKEMKRAGVHLIDLTMGEDPEYFQTGFQPLIQLVRRVKQKTGLPVMVSPGVVPDSVVRQLAEAGGDWLACYQETHNRGLYETLRPGQDYDIRLACKQTAARQGLLVEDGLLSGVGESLDDLADAILAMRELPYDQVRVMTFVPQPGTPMGEISSGRFSVPSSLMERKIIAIMRLTMTDRLIPASLDVDGLEGLKDRLDAGANVVTSIVPPGAGLAGVANQTLDIEEARRSVTQVSDILTACGLSPASQTQYENWIWQRRNLKTTILSQGAA